MILAAVDDEARQLDEALGDEFVAVGRRSADVIHQDLIHFAVAVRRPRRDDRTVRHGEYGRGIRAVAEAEGIDGGRVGREQLHAAHFGEHLRRGVQLHAGIFPVPAVRRLKEEGGGLAGLEHGAPVVGRDEIASLFSAVDEDQRHIAGGLHRRRHIDRIGPFHALFIGYLPVEKAGVRGLVRILRIDVGLKQIGVRHARDGSGASGDAARTVEIRIELGMIQIHHTI